MNNLQPHFHLHCSWEEPRRKELGEIPTHLLTKWNNREDSKQQWSSNPFYLGDEWDRKQRKQQGMRKNQHAYGEVSISCFCNTANSTLHLLGLNCHKFFLKAGQGTAPAHTDLTCLRAGLTAMPWRLRSLEYHHGSISSSRLLQSHKAARNKQLTKQTHIKEFFRNSSPIIQLGIKHHLTLFPLMCMRLN